MSIRITARPENGIRRVGVLHPAAPVVFPDGYFELGEVEILRRDRDLIVELLDEEYQTPAERRLQLLRDDEGNGTHEDAETLSSAESQPDAGHAPSSMPSHGLSVEQSAAEGEGTNENGSSLSDDLPYFSIADLPSGIASLDEMLVQRMMGRDERTSAKPIYIKRLKEVRNRSEGEE
jgi:hypothetical protein